MSFLKYQDDESLRRGNGRGPLSFARAHLDNMPFRGPHAALREEEYQEFTEVVSDTDFGIFDIKNPEEYKRLREILDRAANKWYQIVDYDKKWVRDKEGNPTVLVYLWWLMPHRELAKNRAQLAVSPTPIPIAPRTGE